MSEEAKRYIKKYFRLNFLESYDSLNKEELDKIITGISNLLVGKYKTKDVVAGKGDHIIYKTIDETLKNKFPGKYAGNINLKRYIKNYISNNFFVNYNDKTLDYIVGRISLKVGPVVSYQSLMNGNENIDKQISIQYEIILRDTVNKIYKYAKDYVMRNVYPMLDIDEVEVSNDLVVKIMNDNKYNVVDLFTRKYDKMIEQMAYENRKKNEQNKPNAYRYIKLFIIGLDDYLEFDELNNLAFAIEETLRDDRYNTKDIVEHKCDRQIESMYNRYMMKKNSVVDFNKPQKIKHEVTQEKINAVVRNLLIVAVSIAVLVGAGKGIEHINDDIEYKKAYSEVMDFDGFKYEYIFYINNAMVEPTAKNTFTFYQKIEELSLDTEKYGYLAFFNAYANVRQDRLYIMDKMLAEARMESSGEGLHNEFYMEMIHSNCFLEFAMSRLADMGCEKIEEEKYQNALLAYQDAMFQHEMQKPWPYISEENQNVIREIMKMYTEYCEDLIVELGQQLEQVNDKGALQIVSTGRRKI